MAMILTAENYHSPEANMAYMSNSSYKNYLDCETMALAQDKGEWVRPTSTECMVGSFLHSWNEGPDALEKFKAETPEMFNKNGTMKAQFVFAESMIDRLANDPMTSYMLEGSKEVILTAEMFGANWKIKVDTLKPDDCIVDLKTTRSIWETFWNPYYQCRVSFIEQFKYFLQLAIYREIERLASGRKDALAAYIVAVSKEAPPDIAVISLDDPNRFKHELGQVEAHMPRILQVKAGEVMPNHCGRCAYCRGSKRAEVISYRDLEERSA